MKGSLRLFDVIGIELEYMIVNKENLEIRPLADQLFKEQLGYMCGDVVMDTVTWSNELVLHVVELKSTNPVSDLHSIQQDFVENIRHINEILQKWDCQLLPTAMHPLMVPCQTRLWPHDNAHVYQAYDKLFNCKSHGWSNVQSTHVNFPFYGDSEFRKLHSAVRMVLPLIPALCGSSPVVEGKVSGSNDTRLRYYQVNQSSIPCIVGRVIPEFVSSEHEYNEIIYKPIAAHLKENDVHDILDPVWVNSRGAIARFDRGSIEIRLMDIQECVSADIAIVSFITELLRGIVDGNSNGVSIGSETLVDILNSTIQLGRRAPIANREYLRYFGATRNCLEAGELLRHILKTLKAANVQFAQESTLMSILEHGNLSERITKGIHHDPGTMILPVYQRLARCLANDELFIPE